MGENKSLLDELSKLMDKKIALLPSKEDMGKLMDEKIINLASKYDVELIRTDIRQITVEVENLKGENEKINKQLEFLTAEHKSISSRYDELDRRVRKNNLIINGVEYKDRAPNAEDLVSFFRDYLGVEMPLESFTVPFASGKVGSKRSMAIVTFLRGEDKWKILQRTKKLKGTPGISIDQDYPEKIRLVLAKLLKLRNLIKVSGATNERFRLASSGLTWRQATFSWSEFSGLNCGRASGIAALSEVRQKSVEQINDFLVETPTPARPPRSTKQD